MTLSEGRRNMRLGRDIGLVDGAMDLAIVTDYDDEDAYKAHGESEHFQTYGFGEAIPLLENRERVFYETLDF